MLMGIVFYFLLNPHINTFIIIGSKSLTEDLASYNKMFLVFLNICAKPINFDVKQWFGNQ